MPSKQQMYALDIPKADFEADEKELVQNALDDEAPIDVMWL